MKTRLLTLLIAIFSSQFIIAQNNVGIGTTTPNPKAILELNATDKGFIAPRLTTAQMLAIAATTTENGLLVYNTDSACYHFYNGTTWKNLCQKGLDTTAINSQIKNYLGGVSFTTIINNLSVDSSTVNYTTINNATVNNITIDSSITNYTTINNAVINNLTVDSNTVNYTTINNATVNNITIDSSITNYTTINNAVINNLTVDSNTVNYTTINNATVNNITIDSSVTNVSTVNILKADTSILNYTTINNAQIDSIQNNYIDATTGNFTNLTVGGQSISSLINDSIGSRAWLITGNNAPANNKLGTLNAQDLHIVANNTEAITILNGTGNVGIGQALPSTKLDVLGAIKFSGTLQPAGLQGTAGQVLTSNGAGVPTWNTTSVSNTYSNTTGNLSTTVNGVVGATVNLPTNQAITDSITAQAWTLKGNAGTNPNTNFIGTIDNKSLRLRTNNTEKMIVDSTGNVGVGKSNPDKRLDVNGDVQLNGNLFFGLSNTRTQNRNDAGLQGNVGAQSGFYQNDGITTTNYPAGATSYWHLIDTRHDNPANNYALQIAGSFFDQDLYYRKTDNNPATPWSKLLSITGTNNSKAWLTSGNAGTNPNTNFIGTTDNTSLRFRTNNTSKMVIDSTGRVGIGTNKPVYVSNHGLPTLLDVRGSAVLQGRLTLTRYGDTPLDLKPTWHIDQDSLYRAFRIFRQPDIFTNGAIAVWIDSTLKVGIGSVSPKAKLDVNGNARIVGQSNFSAALDTSYDLSLETNVTNRRLLFGGNGSGYTLQSTELSTKNNLSMALNPLGGNVGVGLINPTALFQVEKNINTPSTPGNIFVAQHDIFNNSTLTATGNITANLSRVINSTSATMQATATSIVGSESSFTNNGTLNGATANAFGAYNIVLNDGTFALTGEVDGGYNRVVNNVGKTITAPSTRGVIGVVRNEGTLVSSSSFGALGSFENTGTANVSSNLTGGYFNIENATGATINTSYARGAIGVVGNSGILNGAVAIGVEGGLDLRTGSTTTLTSEAKGGAFFIVNATGTTTNVPFSKAAQSYIANYGTYNGTSMWATENYINNAGTVNLTGGLRGGNMVLSNATTGTITSGDAIAGAINLDNRGTINIPNNGTIRVGNMELYNEGTITAGYMQGGVFSVLNKASGTINLTKQLIAGGNYVSNFGSMTAKYAYAGDISFYNKGNLHTGHQRGANIYITNDSSAVTISDSSYVTAVIENNNFGTLTTENQRSILSSVQNLPGSTANVVRMIATESNVTHSGSGTITSAYAMSLNVAKPATMPGTITNSYGLLIGTIQGVNRWGLYQADGGAQNYFEGNVGIGTSTPADKLSVFGNVRAFNSNGLTESVLNNDGGIELYRSPLSSIAPEASGYVDLKSNLADDFRVRLIHNNSNTVNGSFSIQTSTDGQNTTAIERFTLLNANGNVGIGTVLPTEKLHVIGNILASGTITPSDARYKQNIVTLNNSLNNVLKLRGVTYDMKAEYKDKGFGTGSQIGVIAQEVEAVYPQLINTSADGYKGVDYSKFTPILIEAIKEQQAQIQQLNAKHKEEMNTLLKRIEALEKK